MKSETFDVWFDEHRQSPSYGRVSWYKTAQAAYEAGQSASAARIAELEQQLARRNSSPRRETMNVGDFVELGRSGNADDDLLYAGWKAKIIEIGTTDALVDSDEFVRQTGRMQAVSFKTWWPIVQLRKIEPDFPCGCIGRHTLRCQSYSGCD